MKAAWWLSTVIWLAACSAGGRPATPPGGGPAGQGGNPDLAMSSNPQPDLLMPQNPQDLGAQPADAAQSLPDLGQSLDIGATGAQHCGWIFNCILGCNSVTVCKDACKAMGTATAQTKYAAFKTCLTDECTAACATGTSECTLCIQDVQQMPGNCFGRVPCGTCYAEYDSCIND